MPPTSRPGEVPLSDGTLLTFGGISWAGYRDCKTLVIDLLKGDDFAGLFALVRQCQAFAAELTDAAPVVEAMEQCAATLQATLRKISDQSDRFGDLLIQHCLKSGALPSTWTAADYIRVRQVALDASGLAEVLSAEKKLLTDLGEMLGLTQRISGTHEESLSPGG